MVDHSSHVSVEKRELTSREAELTKALTSSNSEWASVDVNSLRVVAECRCGCRSVAFAEPAEPQNARAVGHHPLPGGEELAPLELLPDAGSDDPLVGAIDVPEEE